MAEEIDLYLRKSKIIREEDPRDLTSIIAQEDRGRAWAAKHGYEVRHVWRDNLSAWSDVKRPEFDGALSALHKGEVPALWCAYLDRFTRKGVEEIVPILGKARVIFDYEGLDSANERDRRWIIDRAEQAREFSARLSYNIKSTKTSQRSRGKWLAAAPYGLEIADPKTRKLQHSDKWSTVILVFTELAEGTSQRGLCQKLNREKIASPAGGQWQVSTISAMVHNPVYEGWQSTRRRGKHIAYRDEEGNLVSVLAAGVEPVPPELVRNARVGGSAVPRGGKRHHTLSGEDSCCEGCGGSITCNGQMYLCAGYLGGKICPRPAMISRVPTENYVRDRWVARLSAADDDDPILPVVASRYGLVVQPDSGQEVEEAVAALNAAQTAVDRVVAQMRAGFYDPPFDKDLPRIQAEVRSALETAKTRLEAVRPAAIDITFLRDAETAQAAWDEAGPQLRRDFAWMAIKRITLRKGERGQPFNGASRITIEWHGE